MLNVLSTHVLDRIRSIAASMEKKKKKTCAHEVPLWKLGKEGHCCLQGPQVDNKEGNPNQEVELLYPWDPSRMNGPG